MSLLLNALLEKQLPLGAIVHHVDENRSNNNGENLVICPSASYHMILHRRMKALTACGNANWRRCVFCGKYDAPEMMYVNEKKSRTYHRQCESMYKKTRYAKRLESRKLADDEARMA